LALVWKKQAQVPVTISSKEALRVVMMIMIYGCGDNDCVVVVVAGGDYGC